MMWQTTIVKRCLNTHTAFIQVSLRMGITDSWVRNYKAPLCLKDELYFNITSSVQGRKSEPRGISD